MVTYTDHECRIAICMFLVVSQCWKERDNNETVALMSQAAPLRVPGWFIDAPYLFTWLWVTTREPWFFPGKVNGMDDPTGGQPPTGYDQSISIRGRKLSLMLIGLLAAVLAGSQVRRFL